MVPSSSACALRSPAMAAPTLYAPASPPEAAGRGRRESTGFRKTNYRDSCRRSTRYFTRHRNDGHAGWVDEGNLQAQLAGDPVNRKVCCISPTHSLAFFRQRRYRQRLLLLSLCNWMEAQRLAHLAAHVPCTNLVDEGADRYW